MPDDITGDSDTSSPHAQTALALAALAVAFASALQEINPNANPLAVLQSKVARSLALLRRTPDAVPAARILRTVRDALRNPDIIEQPNDGAD